VVVSEDESLKTVAASRIARGANKIHTTGRSILASKHFVNQPGRRASRRLIQTERELFS
jgi:hypothetical protein